jgi:hypothetical protein
MPDDYSSLGIGSNVDFNSTGSPFQLSPFMDDQACPTYGGFSETPAYTPPPPAPPASDPIPLGPFDYVSSGMSGITTGLNGLSTAAGIDLEEGAVLGVQTSVPALVNDLPSGVAGVIGVGQATQAWINGDYTGAAEASTGTLGAIAGAEGGAAGGALIGDFVGGAVGTVLGPAGTVVGAAAGAYAGYQLAEPVVSVIAAGETELSNAWQSAASTIQSPSGYTPYNAMGDFSGPSYVESPASANAPIDFGVGGSWDDGAIDFGNSGGWDGAGGDGS